MKLATFTLNGETRVGKVLDQQVLDLAAADPSLPRTLRALLQGGEALLARVRDLAPIASALHPLASVHLRAPVPEPQKFMGIGLNYTDHAEEARRAGIKIPDSQVWFAKQPSCITGPFDPIELPRVSSQLDYEVELGVVIGRRCRHVRVADAGSVIAGYFVTNDVTVRDWQHRNPQWTLGKSFDTHGPCGPWMVTADEIADPQALTLRLSVNGELRQSASTALMIHSVFAQIEHLSTAMTLEPGDLIATGTCAGVGIGMKPPRFLQIGDVVRAEIKGIGHIENTVVAEPVRTFSHSTDFVEGQS